MAATTSTSSASQAPAIEPEAYYTVSVIRPFTFERVRFGQSVASETNGALLTRLLASEHADAVGGYQKSA